MISLKEQSGEYISKGNYHKKLDTNWKYYPVYLAKKKYILTKCLELNHKGMKFLDAGCGEGVIVDELNGSGVNIIGLDMNYHSKLVKRGDITKMPFKNNSFDVILCLDVLEHLDYITQKKALLEIKRVLKKGGTAIFSIPNIAHFASRFVFLFGKLLRTSAPERHLGERTASEWKSLLSENFKINYKFGIFPTFPLISIITFLTPKNSVFLHKFENILFGKLFSSYCFLLFFETEK